MLIKRLFIVVILVLILLGGLHAFLLVHAAPNAAFIVQDGGDAMNRQHQEPSIPLTRGAYVTGSSAPDPQELAWMSKFEIVHAGGLEDPLPKEAIDKLRSSGVRTILMYDWLPAGYHYTDGESDDPFMAWIYEHRDEMALNPNGPFPHCTEEGYTWCEDYYYDLGNPAVRTRRVDDLVNLAKSHDYDGVFFDWGNDWFLDEPGFESMKITYQARHPDFSYAQAIADLFAKLRSRGLIVQPNQGFRNPEALLPVADLDMTESYITDYDYDDRRLYVDGMGDIEAPETVYYPVSDDPHGGSLADTLYYLNYLKQLVADDAGPDFEGMVFMNYAAPTFVPTDRYSGTHRIYRATIPRNAIYYGYAMSRLIDEPSYTEIPFDHALERDPIYFYDLGEPLGKSYEAIPGGYVRYYTGGFVLAGEWPDEISIDLSSPLIATDTPVYDAFERKWLRSKENAITVHISPHTDAVTGRVAPSGRVFIYGTEEGQGVTYYVAPWGDNANPGTYDRPWATPGYGSRQLHPGDTLVIRGGRYTLSAYDADIITPPAGRPDAWITIRGEAGNRPVLAGRDNLLTAINLSGVQYVRVENLEITHDDTASGEAVWFRDGLEIMGEPAAHIVLKELYIHHVDEFGMNIQDVANLQILNCRIEYAGFGALGGPAGEQGGWRNVTIRGCSLSWGGHYYRGGDGADRPYDRPDGFGIEPAEGPVLIEDTVAAHNYGDGIDSKARSTTLRRAIVANNACDGVKLWGGDSRVENTLIYGRGDGDATVTPWAAIVIDTDEPGARFDLVHVTVDDVLGRNYLMYVQYDHPDASVNLHIRNSIFSGRGPHSPIYVAGASSLVVDHDLFYFPQTETILTHGAENYTCTDIATLGVGNFCDDPRFARPAWGDEGDYHLQADSPAIDAGVDAGVTTDIDGDPRPSGLAPDIGADEYIASVYRLWLPAMRR